LNIEVGHVQPDPVASKYILYFGFQSASVARRKCIKAQQQAVNVSCQKLPMCKFIVISLFSLCFCSCFQLFDVGQNTFIKESYNPQQSKKAVLFLKGGNATTDNSLQVTVNGYEYELENKEVGNTFIVDSDHNNTIQDSAAINFIWLSNDTLQIDFDGRLRTFIQNRSVNGVTIMYKTR
jgi:hypothetical protein